MIFVKKLHNFQVCSSLTQIAVGPQAETLGKMQTRENCRISALATNLEMVGGGERGEIALMTLLDLYTHQTNECSNAKKLSGR